MIKFSFSLPVGYEGDVSEAAAKKLRVKYSGKGEIIKKSLDARDKSDLRYVYTVAFETDREAVAVKNGASTFEKPDYSIEKAVEGAKYTGTRPVVVGAGPCGLFAALTLAQLGARPILIDRGKDVDERAKDVEDFFSSHRLDPDSNVLFGAGGAGTFSDGKLTTGTNSPYVSTVLYELARCGAPEEIVYLNKPHVGTDRLREVVKNMIVRLHTLGAEVRFGTAARDFLLRDGKVSGVVTDQGTILTDRVYLALGHSARDTFEVLYRKGAKMVPKTFSMGTRIEHLQTTIDRAQYGRERGDLPPADYKAAVDIGGGNKLYTFCMCPGGTVINASGEAGGINVNGMSYYARDGKNANAALLVNVNSERFGDDPLAGVEYQRIWERRAYAATGGFFAPAQTYGDFLSGRTDGFFEIGPSCLGGAKNADLNAVLPDYVAEGIKQGVRLIGRRIRGFDDPHAVLTGPETRSSCPLRILRDERGESSISGLYPMGEGAGYAGGITSAAADGIRVVLSSLS
ncbi:MAG: hypothetical protein IJ735_03225 [Clostridia bacterium]|nr:hypothetical protein [Clostridia bacterium]